MSPGRRWAIVALALIVALVVAAVWDGGNSPPPSTVVAQPQPEDTTTTSTAPPSTTTTSVPPTAVYHVAVDGDDNNGDGSEDGPWATIEQAESEAVDGSLILVGPGEYEGENRLRRVFDSGITIRSAEPYQARLRNNGQVIACYVCAGITIEGFDMAHEGGEAERYVIQIQDSGGEGIGGHRLTLRNNVIHNSQNNDLVKINNGAGDILIDGNVFYNQRGPDSHIDINSVENVTVTRNIFFNEFGEDLLGTASFIVIKDSNGDEDMHLGAENITVSGNVMLNWQGDEGAGFFSIGEDNVPYHQAHDIMVENNLLLGNSSDRIRAAFLAKGIRDVTFRNNTIVGDLPSETFGIRLSLQRGNPPNERVGIYNNIWSDPFGTMGTEVGGSRTEFADAPTEETLSIDMAGNLFWNGGEDIPVDPEGAVRPTDDRFAVFDDPLLPGQGGLVTPVWNPEEGRFADGSTSIAEAFTALVERYGVPAPGSPVIDAAVPSFAPEVDILGNPRVTPDIGAVEVADLRSTVTP
jgi:hypothetical protein